MVKKTYKTKVSNLIKKSKEKGIIKTYSQFCDTDEGKKDKLAEDEVNYYTSKSKGETKYIIFEFKQSYISL